ncbi:HAMP domain-containing protein [Ramlibacter sp. USB13]|uniref:HAMP domain-containing protein n=1 Tax=Ramlibacter cellulosilyticus TaxID=2764187 RepID=A0A923MPE0_9BURK|nr:methyl-accepting chemotaxis protein [Ramlibacter cellulosilyticus]MBC5782451.1 HAMP domain-containing protein [Ramlibacter cellulosilyticus]
MGAAVSELSLPVPRVAAGGVAPIPVARVANANARSLFRRATIQTRLTVAFTAIGLMSLFVTGVAIFQLHGLERQAFQDVRTARAAGELHAAAAANAARATALAFATDPAVPQQLLPAFRATEQLLDELHRELASRVAAGEGQSLLRQADEGRQAFRKAWEAALASRAREERMPTAAATALPPAADAYVGAAAAVLAFHAGEGAGAAALQGRAQRATWELLGLTGALWVLTLPFVVVLIIHILRPLYGAVRIARQVADGNLTVKVRTGGRDEMARLMLALDDMTENLRRIVGEVVRSAGAVADAGEQVRAGQGDLAQRTEAQASTLEETASSLEELTATVTQNADTARTASQLALDAADIARKGGDVVSAVVRSMDGISGSSRRIADIIGVIDGIAFQTNILALNAAVEAARAGEQGRGFAVVAAEVRNLAQRSAAAAREIKGLIQASAGEVENGAKLVDAAGNTMQEIVASVKKVSDLIAEIAAASEEQRTGIEQVNTAIAQMDEAVQQNAALVDHTGQSTEALHRHSGALLASVAQFRLAGEAEPARISVSP